MAALRKATVAPADDAVLVERLRRSDTEAFRELYRRHARYVAGVVYRLLGRDDELDDIVQETFLTAIDDIHALRDPQKVRSWLTAIAIRRTKRYLIRHRRTAKLDSVWSTEIHRQGNAERSGQLDELYDALNRLPPKLRVPLMLSRAEGFTLAEVAEACGKSVATIKRRIVAAESRLRRLLHAK